MSDSKPIRVMIVDDHDMVRDGLAAMLDTVDRLFFAGEAASGEEAVRLCSSLQPDVILMDLMMPGMDGIEATRLIHEMYPDIKIVVLTSFQDEKLVHDAFQAGAISYLLKSISMDELAKAIEAAYAGQATLAQEATEALIKAATDPLPPGHDLTPREREVLALLSSGMSNRQIGQQLHISPSTVKHHVSHILAKLNASGRAEAAVFAVQHNLVE